MKLYNPLQELETGLQFKKRPAAESWSEMNLSLKFIQRYCQS
jgi:hypothetical protein